MAGGIVKRLRRSWGAWALRRAKKRLPGYKPLYTYDHPTTHGCNHQWVVEDRHHYGERPGQDWYLTVVCARCRGARCGHRADPNPCMLVRHHREFHRCADGTGRKVGA